MAEVLPALSDGQSYFSPSPLRRSPASQSSLFLGSPNSCSPKSHSPLADHTDILPYSLSSSELSSPPLSRYDVSHTPSAFSTPASSLSLNTYSDEDDEEEEKVESPGFHSEDGLPNQMDNLERDGEPRTHGPPSSVTPEEHPTAEDDTAVRQEPSQHVDYLSHDWDEQDIAASWRHIVSKRKIYGERSRLENASWRTWAKSKNNLKTVSPEALNWLKDCDVTWLYGPLQTAPHRSFPNHASEPTSRLSKSNSFLHKKPILKKRSVSELMLQKSLSASSLVKQAAASVQAQQTSGYSGRHVRPEIGRAVSDFVSTSSSSKTASRDLTDCFSSRSTSGLQTPDHGEKKHIRFDDKVEQCIAIDLKDGDFDEEEEADWAKQDDDEDSDDGLVMMKSSKKKPLSRSNSRTSFSGENKIIAKLPATTLKYRTDSPDVTEKVTTQSHGFNRNRQLSPSPSQETLRPSNPSMNFLLPDDDDEVSWEPSNSYRRTGPGGSLDGAGDESSREANGLRRTASGMFMPYDEEDEEQPTGNGLLGRVVDTVNTARDIAHVIWNVGWKQ